jgi:hypothetical protein
MFAMDGDVDGDADADAEPERDPVDPYEYLLREADDAGDAADDGDAESSATFEDDSPSIASEDVSLSGSPDVSCALRRHARASEAPMYTGPELWFDDDDEFSE